METHILQQTLQEYFTSPEKGALLSPIPRFSANSTDDKMLTGQLADVGPFCEN